MKRKAPALLLSLGCIVFCLVCLKIKTNTEQTFFSVSREVRERILPTVILDAGHGGEDGGAVGAEGLVEKDVNLAISNDIAAYFSLFGIPYLPVRTTDTAVGDASLGTTHARKRSDILFRSALVNETENALLLSVHQNFFEQPQYSGTQVFYSANCASSAVLAACIQKAVCSALQPENTREIKASGSSIYLLYHAKTTAVLVECGFLSNPAEAKKLNTPGYQAQMAYYIFKGLNNYLNLSEEQ